MTTMATEFLRTWGRIFGAAMLAVFLVDPSIATAKEGVINLHGGGASFPAPLYLRWFRDYYRAHPEVRPDYQAIGSGAGVTNFLEGRLDFAGTDVPLTPQQVADAKAGVVQLPVTAGAVVLAYHLPGADGLKLSREAVAGIFSGRIERWNDPIITGANPGLTIPDEPVTVVVRSDASGTSYVMSRYLSAIDPEFAREGGPSLTPVWSKAALERGSLIAGRGNDGVASYVKAIPGAIGYVQYSYAALPDMQMATLENKAGNFVAPTSDAFKATMEAVVAADRADRREVIADPDTESAYPIVALSWILMHKEYKDPAKLPAMKDLIRYSLTDGQSQSERLGYIPAPPAAQRILLEWLDKTFQPTTAEP